MKKVLTIAGSDTIGGAGIQADIKTISAFQCYAMSVITAITAQNTTGVFAAEDVSPTLIQKQITAVFDDVPPDALKIGMLSTPKTILAVSDSLKKYPLPPIVLDPVMISKSGFSLLDNQATELLKEELFPLSFIITPNIPEAETLCGFSIQTHKDMEYAAGTLLDTGCKSVLLKGGHLKNTADDLFFDGKSFYWFSSHRIQTKNTHGTGCTLSSAIASGLAQGLCVIDAIRNAKNYITEAISHSFDMGKGCGPTHHFYKMWQTSGSEVSL